MDSAKALDAEAALPDARRSASRTSRRFMTAIAALALSVGLVGVGAQAASALTTGFTHYMPGSNVLYWFAPVYNHSTTGPIGINTTDIPTCGASMNVGLWSPQTGNQFTQSLTFTNDSSAGIFTNSASGNANIGPVGFSMDARRGGACNPEWSEDPIVRFQGSLTY